MHFAPVAGIDSDEMEVDGYFYKSVNTNDTIQFKLKAADGAVPGIIWIPIEFLLELKS